jgi:hypothetical protein
MSDDKQSTLPPELANLANQADTHAAEVATTDTAAPASSDKPQISCQQALTGYLEAARDGLCSYLDLETPKQTLADDKIAKVAEVMAPVLEKYGLSMAGGVIPIEVTAILTAGPILWTAAKTALFELKQKEAKAAAEARLRTMPVVPMDVTAGMPYPQGGPNG